MTGVDGAARGDELIVRRRHKQALERKLSAMTFADRSGAAGAAVRKEIDALREAERLERVERNFGQGESTFGVPTGA